MRCLTRVTQLIFFAHWLIKCELSNDLVNPLLSSRQNYHIYSKSGRAAQNPNGFYAQLETKVKLSCLQVLKPEGAICFIKVVALVAVVAMHTVRIDHELEVLALAVQCIKKLEGVLVVHVVVTCSVSQLEHDWLDSWPGLESLLSQSFQFVCITE